MGPNKILKELLKLGLEEELIKEKITKKLAKKYSGEELKIRVNKALYQKGFY